MNQPPKRYPQRKTRPVAFLDGRAPTVYDLARVAIASSSTGSVSWRRSAKGRGNWAKVDPKPQGRPPISVVVLSFFLGGAVQNVQQLPPAPTVFFFAGVVFFWVWGGGVGGGFRLLSALDFPSPGWEGFKRAILSNCPGFQCAKLTRARAVCLFYRSARAFLLVFLSTTPKSVPAEKTPPNLLPFFRNAVISDQAEPVAVVLPSCPAVPFFPFFWKGVPFKVNQPTKDALFFPWPLGI